MSNYTRKKVDEYGNVHYYKAKGELHRTDGPAVEHVDAYKAWYVNGKLHRLDGPAVEHDGPAVEHVDAYKAWYVNDKLHRTDGPAVIWANGEVKWYINDKKLTEEEVRLLQNEIKIKKALGLLK